MLCVSSILSVLEGSHFAVLNQDELFLHLSVKFWNVLDAVVGCGHQSVLHLD